MSLRAAVTITDACRVAITHLFREMDLNRVEIRCAACNAKSGAIPRRLGSSNFEGTHRDAELS